jgi:hypothetical protein
VSGRSFSNAPGKFKVGKKKLKDEFKFSPLFSRRYERQGQATKNVNDAFCSLEKNTTIFFAKKVASALTSKNLQKNFTRIFFLLMM